jgi:hypothetical protein
MATGWEPSEFSGVAGDGERESMVVTVVVDIADEQKMPKSVLGERGTH